jgi:hypothetical protein
MHRSQPTLEQTRDGQGAHDAGDETKADAAGTAIGGTINTAVRWSKRKPAQREGGIEGDRDPEALRRVLDGR